MSKSEVGAAKHTPGPWHVADGFSNVEWRNFSVRGFVAEAHRVMTLSTVTKSQPHALANARLIAAAPDLLDALRAIVENCDDVNARLSPDFRAAVAAIAKATGSAE